MKVLTAPLIVASLAILGKGQLAGPDDQRATRSSQIKGIYFLEFETDTLFGVSSESIRSQYDITSLVVKRADKLIKPLLEASEPGKLNDSQVRLRFDLVKGAPIIVDRNGNVRRQDGTFKMSAAQFRALKTELFVMMPKPQLPK